MYARICIYLRTEKPDVQCTTVVYTVGNLDVTGGILKLRDRGGFHFLLLAILSSTAYHRPVLHHLLHVRRCRPIYFARVCFTAPFAT